MGSYFLILLCTRHNAPWKLQLWWSDPLVISWCAGSLTYGHVWHHGTLLAWNTFFPGIWAPINPWLSLLPGHAFCLLCWILVLFLSTKSWSTWLGPFNRLLSLPWARLMHLVDAHRCTELCQGHSGRASWAAYSIPGILLYTTNSQFIPLASLSP